MSGNLSQSVCLFISPYLVVFCVGGCIFRLDNMSAYFSVSLSPYVCLSVYIYICLSVMSLFFFDCQSFTPTPSPSLSLSLLVRLSIRLLFVTLFMFVYLSLSLPLSLFVLNILIEQQKMFLILSVLYYNQAILTCTAIL